MRKWRKYPLELELEKLFREVRILVRKAGRFFFTIPKRKDEKMIYLIETCAWLLLTFALILRVGRF